MIQRYLTNEDLENLEIEGAYVYNPECFLTPPTFTDNVNNFDPEGMKNEEGRITKTILRLTSDSDDHSLTGIVPSIVPKGNVLTIVNVGTTGKINVEHNHEDSDPESRILCGEKKSIAPNYSLILYYDTIDSRWRAINED